MGPRPRKRVALALWALVGSAATGATDGSASAAGWLTGGGVLGVRAQASQPLVGRWAQSSALLSPADDPTLVVVSGKSLVAGQTVDSTPSASSALSLNLSVPITDLTTPPWSMLDNTGPISSYASLVPLSSTSALFFGGDAPSDPTVAVQTGIDSSWLLSLTASASTALASTWTHETAASWPSQPQRRENAYTASATNGRLSRAWLYGGQRPDGSGSTFAELWELQVAVGRGGAVSVPRWAAWSAAGLAPPPMYDGVAVLVPSTGGSTRSVPAVYLVGGVQVEAGTAALADLASVWCFTPTNALGGGAWARVDTTGAAPQGRRGHVAVEIGGGKIWIQGGRNLDGAAVLSDAWVLDTRKKKWEQVEEGEQVWGHSAAMVGETVVLAFGYGVNVPAPTSLSVYAPRNDSWLSAYYPSFATVVSNPKASGSSSRTSAAVGDSATETFPIADGSTSAATPTGAAVDPASTDSPSVGDYDNSPSSPEWTAPGAAPGGSGLSGSPDSGSPGEDAGAPPSKSTIAGAVVGSLLGALVLVVGAGFAFRRYRDAHGQRYATRGFTGDDDIGRPSAGRGAGAGASSLMAEHCLNGGYASSEAYNLGKALPAAPSVHAGAGVGSGVAGAGGVFGALVGLLSPRERYVSSAAGRKRRFDILEDEENDDVWDAREGKEGWTRFGEEREEYDAAVRDGRGGMAIWDGFGALGSGVDRLSGSIRSSRSYLGGALGGFIGATTRSSGRQRLEDEENDAAFADAGAEKRDAPEHAYSAVAPLVPPTFVDPALTPIAEWDEDDARSEPDDLRTLESGTGYAPSSATHTTGWTQATGSTRPTSCEISPSKAAAARIARPFSPASSLYGASFGSQQALGALGPDLARTSSGQSQASARFVSRSNSSWWSRLNLPKTSHGPDLSTPTAAAAIRDPAPAPSLADITATDPFVDKPVRVTAEPTGLPAASAAPTRHPSYRVSRPDEHGRFANNGHLVRGEHDASVSSNTSEVTATSSVLEDRLRNMDVVQRIRSGGSGGDSSVEVTPTLGSSSDGAFGRLPDATAGEDPFADAPQPPARPQLAYTPGLESVLWNGSLASAHSDVGPGVRPSTPPLRSAASAILPPAPSYAPPDSPRKRLVGPRPQPLSPSAAPGMGPFAGPPRSNSVKDLVASIERRGSLPLPATTAGPRKRPKVEHGFAKKPVLYIANPDVD
ncbi:hypothetical protein JCM3770_007227 [Rhodotorula araucariae]